MATEDDLLGAVPFLATDLSGYVTGENIDVDVGGVSGSFTTHAYALPSFQQYSKYYI